MNAIGLANVGLEKFKAEIVPRIEKFAGTVSGGKPAHTPTSSLREAGSEKAGGDRVDLGVQRR